MSLRKYEIFRFMRILYHHLKGATVCFGYCQWPLESDKPMTAPKSTWRKEKRPEKIVTASQNKAKKIFEIIRISPLFSILGKTFKNHSSNAVLLIFRGRPRFFCSKTHKALDKKPFSLPIWHTISLFSFPSGFLDSVFLNAVYMVCDKGNKYENLKKLKIA